MIIKYNEYPKLKWWQRRLKKLCGGQDLVAVIVVDNNTVTTTWFSGVNMEVPIIWHDNSISNLLKP